MLRGLRVQKDPHALDRRRAEDDDLSVNCLRILCQSIDIFNAGRFPRLRIGQQSAHDGVCPYLEAAGCQSEPDGKRNPLVVVLDVPPVRHADVRKSFLDIGQERLFDLCRFRGPDELSVWTVWNACGFPVDAERPLDDVVVRRQVFVRQRPIDAVSTDACGFELVIRHAGCMSGPRMKAAAELPAPDPEERFSSWRRIGILSVVDVELLGGLGEGWASGLNVLALNRRSDAPYRSRSRPISASAGKSRAMSRFLPASSRTTFKPPSVSSLTAHEPEAPEPTTMASYVDSLLLIRACLVRHWGRRLPQSRLPLSQGHVCFEVCRRVCKLLLERDFILPLLSPESSDSKCLLHR